MLQDWRMTKTVTYESFSIHCNLVDVLSAKYPQVKQLMGHDPRLKYIVTAMVVVQVIIAHLLQDASWTTILILAYCFGGVINHSMTLAIHEISHNLAFGHKYPWRNRVLGIFGNLIVGVPYSVIFKKYHIEHHKFQGDEEKDLDIPSQLEAKLFHNTASKFLWVMLQPFFYALRPLFLRPKPFSMLELINFSVQLSFNAALWYFSGPRSLAYLVIGTLLAMGFHPVAGHFISEHYMFHKGYETYSYYGPLNAIVFNVGYHNEHHDFPSIPGCNLPKVSHKCASDIVKWLQILQRAVLDILHDLFSWITIHICIYKQMNREWLIFVPVTNT